MEKLRFLFFQLFPFAQLVKMIDVLVTVKVWTPKFEEEITKLLDFDDIKLATLLALQPHVNQLQQEKEKNEASEKKNDLVEENVVALLKLMVPRKGAEEKEPFKFLHRLADDAILHDKKAHLFFSSSSSFSLFISLHRTSLILHKLACIARQRAKCGLLS